MQETDTPVTTIRRTLAAVLAAAVLLSGCSAGGDAESASDNPEATSSVSTPVEGPTTKAPNKGRFATALAFTRLVHVGKYSRAASMVEADSPAARYIAHQVADTKAYQIDGRGVSGEEDEPTIDGDEKTGKILIEPTGDSAAYTWKQFAYDDAGKIRAWTGASGPVGSVLWTRESRDSGLGVSARLVSAYRTNAGSMEMVVEFAAKRDVQLSYGASYSPRGGYRQNATDQCSQNELDKGEQTLCFYTFEDAKFKGTLRLKVASAKGYQTANLVLAIR